jgi:hypothetical protein
MSTSLEPTSHSIQVAKKEQEIPSVVCLVINKDPPAKAGSHRKGQRYSLTYWHPWPLSGNTPSILSLLTFQISILQVSLWVLPKESLPAGVLIMGG